MVVTSTVVNEVAARAIFPVKIVWQADPTTSREFDSPYRLGAWVEFLSETEFADTSCTDFRGRQLSFGSRCATLSFARLSRGTVSGSGFLVKRRPFLRLSSAEGWH